MNADDFLRRLVAALNEADTRFMVTGSFASSFHGVPRTTQDIDIVVELTSAKLDALLKQLPEAEYYVSSDAARDAVLRKGQFNVIDLATGWKADLIVRKDRAFSREEFERMQPAVLFGIETFVASAEDILLAKLEWATMSDSELQKRDISGILDTQGDGLDRGYIERWLEVLGVKRLWDTLRG